MKQFWFLQQAARSRLKWLLPTIAGGIMLVTSVLPWLQDPLNGNLSAWQLPIDLGWQIRIPLWSYGLLCCLCAIYSFLVAFANWKPFKGSSYFVHQQIFAGLLCCIPVVLFLTQYILADTMTIDKLSQSETQLQLIQHHFGYDYPLQLVYIDPFTSDTSTLVERIRLLIDLASGGVLLPCLSAWLLIDYRRFTPGLAPFSFSKKIFSFTWLMNSILGLIFLLILGRAPISTICEYQAKNALATGNYTKTLYWLNAAYNLNPALEQVYYYHVERGEALYFLYPRQETDDTRAYLAWTYSQQGDDLDAYQELLAVWKGHPTSPWIVNEMSYTLEKLSEFDEPLKGIIQRRAINDDSALPWLQLLIQVNPSTLYGHYIEGRIQYDLHDYGDCMQQMAFVLKYSSNANIDSSAYTYMALSYAGQGDIIRERALLLKAIALDINYTNNTAREELSGLR